MDIPAAALGAFYKSFAFRQADVGLAFPADKFFISSTQTEIDGVGQALRYLRHDFFIGITEVRHGLEVSLLDDSRL